MRNSLKLFVQKSQLKKGKEPALIEDVVRISSLIPKNHPDKEEEVSLYLMAAFSGARSITCENVLLQDITWVAVNPDGIYTVKVHIRKKKKERERERKGE